MKIQTSPNPGRSHLRVAPDADVIREEALAENTDYRALVARSTDLISRHTLGGTFLFASDACLTLLGYRPEELVGRNAYELIHLEDHSHIKSTHLTPLNVPGVHRTTYRFRQKGGDHIWLETTAQVIRHPETDTPQEIIAVSRDVSERKLAYDQMREKASLLDQTQDAIVVRDLEDRVVFWNKSAERLYGITADDAVGVNLYKLLLQRELGVTYEEASAAFARHGEWVGELKETTPDGRDLIVESRWRLMRDDNGRPHAVVMVNTDVTDKKSLELQFFRQQRLESVGRLSSGIAHNLGNALSPILIAIHLLQQKCLDQESQQWLELLRINAEHGGRMITQLLSFARGVEGGRVPVCLKYLITEVVEVLRNTFPKTIEIKHQVPEDLWTVAGDSTHLHQVLMNLCVNANDAMPQAGRLTIEAQNIILDETYSLMHSEARPGHYVQVKVIDTGEGIEPEILGRIFDPFFTTHRRKDATGLGLATVLGIIKGHKGFIDVASEMGKGTLFTIYLPAQPSADSERFEIDQVPLGNGELVLTADDDAAILEITKEILETSGYKVLLASDGVELLAHCADNKSELRVVMLDMDLPDLGGASIVRVLNKLAPNIRIVVTGGHMDHQSSSVTGIAEILLKPYTADTLLRTLARVVGADSVSNHACMVSPPDSSGWLHRQ